MEISSTRAKRKTDYDRRRKRRDIYYTFEEFDIVKKKAEDHGYKNVNEFIKLASLTSKDKVVKSNPKLVINPKLADIRVELRAMGVNINQLAKHMNQLAQATNQHEFVSNSKLLDITLVKIIDVISMIATRN